MYVRQHYNLAVSGKLGQKASGRAAPKSGGNKSSTGSQMKKSGGYGSKGSSRA